MKIVFFGTPTFAAEILEHLIQNKINVVAVITKPDQPQGRSLKPVPSPVKQYLLSKNSNIPIFQPTKASSELEEVITSFSPDFYVVVGYGEILRQNLLKIPKKAPINIHTSLLPTYRGAAPIQRAMMAGEDVMGITVMKMNSKMDAGEILLQNLTNIGLELVFDEVEKKLIELSKESILKVLMNFEFYEKNAKEQDLSKISHAPKIEIEDCHISYEGKAQHVQRKIMAFSAKPGAFLTAKIGNITKRIKILEAVHSSKNFKKGFFTFEDGEMILGCSDGGLKILKLQPEGKNSMSYKDFFNGHKTAFPIEIVE